MIVEYQLPEDLTWYVVSVRFASAYMAKETWERIQTKAEKEHGKLDIGFYRHGPSTDPGRYLTCVTTRRESALWINRQVRGCENNGLPEDEMKAMILRRLDVLGQLHAASARNGSYVVRRPENRGGVLHQDGSMEERVGHG
jgi:hypothetical protein